MADHNKLGVEGENAAANYLKNKGYTILHTNWRKGRYELDIIARTDRELVFIEVKTRTGIPLSTPEDAVDDQKIRHIVSAADHYIKISNLDLPARFDIISITGFEPNFMIDHIEDAFYPPMITYR